MSLLSRLFPLLKGCAFLLERALPEAVYTPLYRRCRAAYSVFVLGESPIASGSLYRVPEQRSEEYAVVAPAGARGEAVFPGRGREVCLTPLQGAFIRCDGSRLDLPDLSRSTDGRAVQEALEPHRIGCDIVICCSFLGRHEVLERVILESLKARCGDRVRWMLTGSTVEDLAFIETMARRTGRAAGFICKNRPLGRKWQTCLQYAYGFFDARLYTVNGSDDIIPARLVDHVFDRHAANQAALGDRVPFLYCTNEWLILSRCTLYSPMILKCSYRYESASQPVGSGRFYSREFLDRVSGSVFDSSQDAILDAHGFLKGRDMGFQAEYYSLADGPLVSVDGDWGQLNTLEHLFKAGSLSISEFSFEGYFLLRDGLLANTFDYLFQRTDRRAGLFR